MRVLFVDEVVCLLLRHLLFISLILSLGQVAGEDDLVAQVLIAADAVAF